MDNNIYIDDNTSVYDNDVFYYADEYIDNVLNGDVEKASKSAVFSGMLKYIYIHVFKPGKNDKVLYGSKSKLDTSNIELLDNIWCNCFSIICAKYNKRKTLLRFSEMIGLNIDTFWDWEKGNARTSSPHRETVKRWKAECESEVYNGAIEENSVGCIFALKANYGYRDQVEIVTNNTNSLPSATVQEIAERHKLAELPQKPPDI